MNEVVNQINKPSSEEELSFEERRVKDLEQQLANARSIVKDLEQSLIWAKENLEISKALKKELPEKLNMKFDLIEVHSSSDFNLRIELIYDMSYGVDSRILEAIQEILARFKYNLHKFEAFADCQRGWMHLVVWF